MSTIEINHPHQIAADTLKEKMENLSSEMKQRYGAATEWKNDTEAEISAPGVTGKVLASDSNISITIELNMMLSMMAGKIEEDIKKYLDKNFS